jgi:hypothetical protein
MLILNTYTVYSAPNWFLILMIILFILSLTTTLCLINAISSKSWFIGVCVTSAILIVTMIFGHGLIHIPSWAQTVREITISEDYPYKELTEHYEVIGTRGDILTVKEKG